MVKPVDIVILGGGTAGWMSAAALSRLLPASRYRITLVSAPELQTVGVGEATIPHIRYFNQTLGIDENEFIRSVGATYKLAIRFKGWGYEASDYCHGFGYSGERINDIEFHHYFLRAFGRSSEVDYDRFCLASLAARAHRFEYPKQGDSMAGRYGYAFHLDATRYADYLREFSLANGVKHILGKVESVQLSLSGDICSLRLLNGEIIEGDWFLDCSGFSARLIEQELNSGYESWQQWLPCDRAVAGASGAMDSPPTYTLSQTHCAGWRWQIPLQHRTGNGVVYASHEMSDDEAAVLLNRSVEGIDESRLKVLSFLPGKRRKSWQRNCVAIGLSSGFLEPLESTSLYLVQVAIEKFIEYLPADRNCHAERQAFNQFIDIEYERIRDFLILHYHQNGLNSSFWRYCATMALPDSLNLRLQLYDETGHFSGYRQGLFMPVSWVTVALGQGRYPQGIDGRMQKWPKHQIAQELTSYQAKLVSLVGQMSAHKYALGRAGEEGLRYPEASPSLYGFVSG
ncbi:tryptophan 7-halogenase [Alteromonas aestuariivivens]|uniref:Tryptophan 7-halogenase n=1 Tax=Alteromonas aestuariivivens TaxID=1938339 RepID=A0A3D8M7B7_9ALTE|nr:tryptophan halogenase family protein [Alteromonas aestuariivivens]RDV25652.1 tryptophan 7-halogenase [Alteromonas aestuariivivens]